jgi:hypothetical protein
MEGVLMSKVNEKPVRVAVFDRVYKAEQAVEALLLEGFEKDQISVICSDPAKEAHFREFEAPQAGDSAQHRAAIGGVIGATLGALATVATLGTAGGVAVVAAGHLVASLAAGGVVGGFVGAMTSRGLDKESADFYEQAVEKGKILVVAEDTSDEGPRKLHQAEKRFEQAGAEPISLHAH